MPAVQVVKVPDALTDEQAASVMLQGLTAQYLLRRTYPVKAGDTILIQAAAGGVGLLVCQWAKALGATVIGTVGSDEKAEIAKAHGCDHAIVYTRENFTKRVREITNGAGVPVVYDSIGKDTFTGSLDCLAPLGMFVSFGNASGPLPPIDSSEFAGRGSLFFTRPTLFTYIAKRSDYEAMSAELFDVLVSGKVKTSINQRYALADVARLTRILKAAVPRARRFCCRKRACHKRMAEYRARVKTPALMTLAVRGSQACAKDRKPIPIGQRPFHPTMERPLRFTRFLHPISNL